MIDNFSATYAKDDAGNKITFSKLEDETLDIIYTIRFKVSKKVSMSFNGVTYDNLIFKDLDDISYSYWISHNNIPSYKLFLLNSMKSIGSFDKIKSNLFYNNNYIDDIEISYSRRYNVVDYPSSKSEFISLNSNMFKIKNTSGTFFGNENKYFEDLFLNSVEKYGNHIDLNMTNDSVNIIKYDMALQNLYLGKDLNNYKTKHIFNYLNNSDFYNSNMLKILKINKDNLEEYNDYITYDYAYHIILKDIKKFQILYPEVLEKINISTDKNTPVTFDDAREFIKNSGKFIDELKTFLGPNYIELFYNFKIEFPDDIKIKFTNKYTNINNVIRYISLYLEFEFTFNAE